VASFAVTLASVALLAAPIFWSCSSDSKKEEAAGLETGGEARPQARRQHLPNVLLTTHEGDTVRFYDDLIKGKIVAINFMYATCEER
jgi:cytochrome oxidase Cu insertion factor (SCO1/SenC/PrrC family)